MKRAVEPDDLDPAVDEVEGQEAEVEGEEANANEAPEPAGMSELDVSGVFGSFSVEP